MPANDLAAVPGGEVIVYQASDGEVRLDVHLDGETVWLTRRQMADVFRTTPRNIGMHLDNVYADGEIDRGATRKDFFIVRSEGERRVKREVGHHNLDAILSVGYRVNSKRAVQFRQWATRVLRQHLVHGHTLNERRLAERGLDEARQTLELLARTLRNQALVDETGSAVLHIITAYADTWRLLLEYDEDRLTTPAGAKPATSALEIDSARAAIDAFRRDLAAKGEASSLFGNPRGDALEAILGTYPHEGCGWRTSSGRSIRGNRSGGERSKRDGCCRISNPSRIGTQLSAKANVGNTRALTSLHPSSSLVL